MILKMNSLDHVPELSHLNKFGIWKFATWDIFYANKVGIWK